MKTATIAGICFLLSFAATLCAQSDQAQPAIALVGGTLIDLSKSGHSANDIPNAVVILRDGKIEAAGPAALVKIPRNTKTLDYAGTYICLA